MQDAESLPGSTDIVFSRLASLKSLTLVMTLRIRQRIIGL
jgi:hypothetical protein